MPVLVSAAEMRAIESAAVEAGATWEGLMDNAGAAVAAHAIDWLGPASQQRALVLAGPGNNGGDALVVAAHLAKHGWPVRVFTWARAIPGGDRLITPLEKLDVGIVPIQADSFRVQLQSELEWCTVIVDGLFGTGLKRDIESPLADIIKVVAASGKHVVAIDIPTGVDSDTGQVRGVALPASLTVATGLLKFGHALQPGKRLAGDIRVGDIKLDEATKKVAAKGSQLTDATVKKILPNRPDDSNKGTFGKAMVVAGSINYIGAAALATEAAMRSGAGLVTLACAGDLLPILAVKLTECTFLPLPSDLGAVADRATDKLLSSLKGCKSLLIGSGLGQEKETAAFIKNLFSKPEVAPHSSSRPIGFARRTDAAKSKDEEEKVGLPSLVVDGDALNILSEWQGWSDHLPQNCVLTPHPGEMGRLTGKSVDEVQADRVGIATEHAAKWKQVVVLKGASTLIAAPDGRVFVSPFSNPALATAGTGDVLAGTITGLLAQGLDPVDAACAGVYLHGVAGELLRDQYGEAGGLAGDLARLMPQAQKIVREGKNG